ncbi:8074_t:CDS:2 [Paraglomus brasilianum]|uniref:8074_t:CDS:1 n=1 Tax=Paraglomus brasilianum TaxID=144538 RepID=A0A9N8ZJ26_9GLOM|nr:8074_t:CDS:2 [Paraglomus brasilianum]
MPRINNEEEGAKMKRGKGKFEPVFVLSGFKTKADAKDFVKVIDGSHVRGIFITEYNKLKKWEDKMYYKGVLRRIISVKANFISKHSDSGLWWKQENDWIAHWYTTENEQLEMALRDGWKVDGRDIVRHKVLELNYVPATKRPSKLSKRTFDNVKKAIWEVGGGGDQAVEDRDRWAKNDEFGYRAEMNKRRKDGMLAFDFGQSADLPISLLATDPKTKYAEKKKAFRERMRAILEPRFMPSS